VICSLILGVGAAIGSVIFAVMVRRMSSNTMFVEQPSFDYYLVDPTSAPGGVEASDQITPGFGAYPGSFVN